MATGGLGQLSVDLLLETQEWTGPLTKAELETSKFAENVNKYLADIANTTKKVEDGLKNIEEASKKTGQSLEDLGTKAWTAVKGFLVFETVKEVFTFMATATLEAEQAAVRLDIVMKNVGAAAGLSSERINDLADALGRTTQFDDEAFKNAAASMIRYGGITQDVLERTLKAAVDFAAFSQQDFPAAADSLAKAVASPAQGIERLQRQIGYIDEETKRYIVTLDKMGEHALAQAEILSLVEKASKGAADAMGETATGQIQKFGNAMANLAEAVGKIVVNFGPTKSFLTMITDRANDLAEALDKMDPIKLAMFLAGVKPKASQMADAAANPQADADREAARHAEWQRGFDEQTAKAVAAASERQKKLDAEAKRAYAKRLADEKEFVGKFKDLHVTEVKEHVALTSWGAEEMLAIEMKRLRAEQAQYESYLDWLKEEYGALYNDIERIGTDAFDALFNGVEDGWKGLMKTLGNDFKKMLMGMISRQVVQPFMQQLISQVGGGLGAYAQSLGAGSHTYGAVGNIAGGGGGVDYGAIVGGAYDYFFGGGGAGSWAPDASTGLNTYTAGSGYNFFGGGADAAGNMSMGGVGYGIVGGIAGYGVANLAGAGERGQAAAASYGAIGAQVGSYFGPWGAIAGWAIGTIAGIATDPDPDAMRKAFFGETKGKEGVTKWKGQSALGEFGFSSGEWLSDSDMDESMKTFIDGITAIDNALARFMSPEEIARITERLKGAGKTYELGMEHGGVTNLGEIIRDRLRIIAEETNEGLGEFLSAFEGPVEDMMALIGAYAASAEEFDVDKILESLKPKGMMEAYQEQAGALATLIEDAEFSAESLNALTDGMIAFQAATVQMVAAIDAAAASMHAMFTATADSIRMDLMSDEEKYAFLQDRSQTNYEALLTETDPAQIKALADKVNADIQAAWALLDDDQKAALGEDFLSRLTAVDATVAEKMQALRDVVIGDSEEMMTTIANRIEAIFTKGDATAETNRLAAEEQLAAARTPIQVVLTSDIVNAVG